MDNHVSEEQFLLEFFGNDGRELGAPKQWFTNNPTDILWFIKDCTEKKVPAFISAQPRSAHKILLGIEKLFFDFDYADKTFVKKFEIEEPDEVKRNKFYEETKKDLEQEVINFVDFLIHKRSISRKIQPMVVKTRKGYHVYIYFDKVYVFNDPQEYVKEVYRTLMLKHRELYEGMYGTMKYLDERVDEDVMRMARIPLSVHEKSGLRCPILKLNNDLKFEEDKIRGLSYYKNYSLKESDLLEAVKDTNRRLANQNQKREELKVAMKNHVGAGIRRCYTKSIESGEMGHQQRTALLIEAWWNGNIHTADGLTKLYVNMHDYKYDKTKYQIDWFFKNESYNKFQPYSCTKMQELGWCLQNDECPIWRKNHEQKPT